jgi:hypothetical protein
MLHGFELNVSEACVEWWHPRFKVLVRHAHPQVNGLASLDASVIWLQDDQVDLVYPPSARLWEYAPHFGNWWVRFLDDQLRSGK